MQRAFVIAWLVCIVAWVGGGPMAADGARGAASDVGPRVIRPVVVEVNELTIPEGSTATVRIRLDWQPEQPVTVQAQFDSWQLDPDLSITAGAQRTFTPQNWNQWQTVTVSAAQDADALNGSGWLSFQANDGSPTSIMVHEDDDEVGVVVSASEIDIDEGGTTTFQVRLTRRPSANAVVNVGRSAGDTDISVAIGGTLTFVPDEWDSWRTVTLACQQDVDDQDGQATITCGGTSLVPAHVIVHERDDDRVVAILVGTTLVDVPEGGGVNLTVQLSRRPDAAVVVQIERTQGDVDLWVRRGASMTIAPENWDRPHALQLVAEEDIDVAAGRAVFFCTAQGCTSASFVANEIDNDVLAVEATVDTVTVPEGALMVFNVRLSHQPAGDIQVETRRVDGDADISVSAGAVLTFTRETWNVYQPVTIAAAQDGDPFAGRATIRCDGSHGTLDVDIAAIEADDESGLRIDFKPPRSRAPRGWLGDDGLVYGDRGAGLSYGWSSDISATGKERDQADSQVRDTFLQPQSVDPDATWRIAVPDGDYEVTVGVGDPAKTQGRYQVTIEGETAVDHVPTRRRRHADGTVQVSVEDGFIDLGNGPDADGNKVQGIEIVPIPPAPSGAG